VREGEVLRMKMSSGSHAPLAHTISLPTQEAEIRGITDLEASPDKWFTIPYIGNTQYRKELVEWFKW
jgi:hypothetical protein